MNPFRLLKINPKILLLVFLVSLLSTTVYAIREYRLEREVTMEGIDHRLAADGFGVDHLLGSEFHDRVAAGRGPNPAEYAAVELALSSASARYGVRRLYAAMEVDGAMRYTAHGAADARGARWAGARFLAPFPAAGEARRALAEGKTLYGEIDEEGGRFRSAFVPLRSPEGRRYVVGAELGVSYVAERLRHNLLQAELLGLAIFLAVLLLGYWLVNMISRPMRLLSDSTRALVANDFQAPPPVAAAIQDIASGNRDEVGDLAGSFLFMEAELQRHIARVKEAAAARERIDSELRVARKIQLGVLPSKFPPFPRRKDFEVFAAIEPAKEMSGDFYDFHLVDEHHLHFTIGDVSGKGVPASIFMASARTLLEANAHELSDPATILGRVNVELSRRNDTLMFVTVFYGVLDLRSGELAYANGGHNLPYRLGGGDPPACLGVSGAPALGVDDEYVFETARTTLRPGEGLLLYTDGVTEAINAADAEFSEARLEALLAAGPSAELIPVVMREVKAFTGETPQSDDITMLLVRWFGERGESR